jgi:hypothetical protein
VNSLSLTDKSAPFHSAVSGAIALVSGILVAWMQSVLPHFGYIPVIALAAGLVLLPSAQNLSARIALNGVLLLGLLPILWWGVPSLNLAHFSSASNFATAIVITGIVYFAVKKTFSHERWLPTFKLTDSLLGASALFMAWLYLPFFSGTSATSTLLQSLRGDIVAHFTMVVKTITTGVSGSAWGVAKDGTDFVYVNYPQHFHSLAAYLGQSFENSSAGIIESYSAAFMAGLALVSIFSVIVLSSVAIEAVGKAKSLWLPGLLVAAVTASFTAGFGASNLQAGFPNFVLAAISVLFVFFIAVYPLRVSVISALAASSGVLLVINCWFLLSPIALGMLVVVFLRLLKNDDLVRHARMTTLASGVFIVVLGYAWSLSLITAASEGIGGPVNVLNVPGGTVTMPIRLVIALCLSVGAMGLVLAVLGKKTKRKVLRVPGWGILTIAFFSTSLLGGLIVLQRIQGDTATYYQEKLANGIFLVLTIVLIYAVVISVQFFVPGIDALTPLIRWPLMAMSWVALFFLLSHIPTFMNGFELRDSITKESGSVSESSERLLKASEVLASTPCPSPVYLAILESDPSPDIANQWAHAMSGTWTEASGPVNTFLANNSLILDYTNPTQISREFLSEFSETCVVVSPEISAILLNELAETDAQRIMTW